jgi:hypothetical protein
MDNRLSFDVYAEITDPRCHVEHDACDGRVSVSIGGTPRETPINLLQLWFKEPATVTQLDEELVAAGKRLDAQRARRQASVDSGSGEG